MPEGDADEALMNAFAVFDADGSGKLSASELRDILTCVISHNSEAYLSEADVDLP